MTQAHRRVPTPPYRAIYVRDGVRQKNCRWCDGPLLKPDGSPDLRRNWHPDCAEAFMIRNHPRELRLAVFKRDHGVCARCGRDTVAHLTVQWDRPTRQALWGGAQNPLWEADHILPLKEGGAFDLSNVQTLCAVPCHREKTSEENRARFTKPKAIEESPPLLAMMR